MSARLVDGKALAERVSDEARERAEAFAEEHGRPPGLSVVLVGEHEPSHVYVRNKERAAQKASIASTIHRLPADVSQASLIDLVERLNIDDEVDGILVQLPLPKHIDPLHVLDCIDPEKDVDGLHAFNAGLLAVGRRGLRPCTPLACMRILEEVGCEPKGKEAVLVGTSNLVGKPMGIMLLEVGATVIFCHVDTPDVPALVRRGDIVIVAVGQPELVRGDWIKPGAVVLDVGINRTDDGKLVGDVHRESVLEVASWLTPVPRGVGPMTVAMLLRNTVEAAEQRGEPHHPTENPPPDPFLAG